MIPSDFEFAAIEYAELPVAAHSALPRRSAGSLINGRERPIQRVANGLTADGDDYVLNGRKWFASNALHPRCEVLLVMGKTLRLSPARQSQIYRTLARSMKNASDSA